MTASNVALKNQTVFANFLGDFCRFPCCPCRGCGRCCRANHPVKNRLAAAEAERARLLASPPEPDDPARVVRLMTDGMERYRVMVADLRTWLNKDPERAQGILAGLFEVIPVTRDGQATVRLETQKILSLVGVNGLDGSGGRI